MYLGGIFKVTFLVLFGGYYCEHLRPIFQSQRLLMILMTIHLTMNPWCKVLVRKFKLF